MTEAEIMKAVECHKEREIDNCCDCPYFNIDGCAYEMSKDALDLINRKNAEIEELCADIDELIIAKDQLFDEAEALIKKARAEAIKEVVGIVKFKVEEPWLYGKNAICRILDQIAKEMGVEL